MYVGNVNFLWRIRLTWEENALYDYYDVINNFFSFLWILDGKPGLPCHWRQKGSSSSKLQKWSHTCTKSFKKATVSTIIITSNRRHWNKCLPGLSSTRWRRHVYSFLSSLRSRNFFISSCSLSLQSPNPILSNMSIGTRWPVICKQSYDWILNYLLFYSL